MSTCKNCGHACHHSDSETCHCGCHNCEHDIKEAFKKYKEALKSKKEVKFTFDFNLTEHQEET